MMHDSIDIAIARMYFINNACTFKGQMKQPQLVASLCLAIRRKDNYNKLESIKTSSETSDIGHSERG